MRKLINNTDVLLPTASSVGACLLVVAVVLFAIVLPRLGGDALLGFVFGQDASQSLLNSSKEHYGPLLESLLSNDLLGRAVVFGLWMFVGLCTFTLIMFLSSSFGAIEADKAELSYVHQNKELLIRSKLTALGFRFTVALLWAIFIAVVIRFVISYFAVTGFVAFGDGGPADWGLFAIASVMLAIATHIQVVFARLIAGKTRLWGD